MFYSVNQAKAAVVEWFELLGEEKDEDIVGAIEHDRLDYSLRPGLVRKLLLLSTSDDQRQAMAGGAYFFEGFEEAREFLNWASFEHKDAEGRAFEDRDYVGERHAYVCHVIGHAECAESKSIPAVVHIERFKLENGDDLAKVTEIFGQGESLVRTHRLLSLSCLYDPAADVYFIVSVGERDDSLEDDRLPDLIAINSEATAAVLVSGVQAERTGDWRFWVFTIWEPRHRAAPAGQAVWPNSPPLPGPTYWNARERAQ